MARILTEKFELTNTKDAKDEIEDYLFKTVLLKELEPNDVIIFQPNMDEDLNWIIKYYEQFCKVLPNGVSACVLPKADIEVSEDIDDLLKWIDYLRDELLAIKKEMK